jgi:signal transduction histidine kinase
MAIYSIIFFGTDTYHYEIILENLIKILLLLAALVYIFLSLVQKNPLMNYLAIGVATQIFFSIISLVFVLTNSDANEIYTSPIFYFELGVICAIVFFLLGLFYKNRQELIIKIKEQEAMKLEVEKQSFENKLTIYKTQQEERNRISADMNDDLGAGMTSIRLYSELAKSKMAEKPGMPIPEIEKISSSADELINNMNSIIWSMSSQNDSMGNMVAYIRSYAIEYLENTGIKPIVTIPDHLPELVVSGTIRRNVFLVVKEALQNVIKHSKATEVSITMTKEPEGFALTIHDNGNGIDFKNLRQFSNGLKNMKKRMQDINIEFTIENNAGTLVRLYAKTR